MNLKGIKLVVGLVSAFWSLFLTYKIIEFIWASELIWFLFWMCVPISIIMGILHALVED